MSIIGVVYNFRHTAPKLYTTPMYVRWQYRWRNHTAFGPRGEADVHWSAILVENERVKGQPKQRHIAYLAGFTESAVKVDPQRCHIWDGVSEALDRLSNRITEAERKKIEAAIAAKVPRPTAADYKDIARKSAQLLGWSWITDRQRAALLDEAEQLQNIESEQLQQNAKPWSC